MKLSREPEKVTCDRLVSKCSRFRVCVYTWVGKLESYLNRQLLGEKIDIIYVRLILILIDI